MHTSREVYLGHEYTVRYEPDAVPPGRWKAVVYKIAVPDDYCTTIWALTKRRAVAKARRYIKRRARRVARHSAR